VEVFFQGVLFGLALTVMVGPIFFALLQTGIEEGFRAGLKVGFGIWTSDLIYISICYIGLSYVMELVKWDNFEFYLGTIGGFILLAVGIGGLISKPIPYEGGKAIIKNSSTLALWLKGFTINTVNPFTFMFWISTMSTVVLKDEFNRGDVVIFFSAILGTIIVTDCIKIYLAKWIRNRMNDKYLLWIRRGGGIVFIVFGIVLFLRVAYT